MKQGVLHSIQTLGAVDGPGLRTVVVLQGCPLQCSFCHSIDTTLADRGEHIDTDELVSRIMRNKPYWQRYIRRNETRVIPEPELHGGVTITGGDPLAQPVFLEDLLSELKKLDVHTVVETSLYTSEHVLEMLIDKVDLWMISIKHMDEGKHLEISGKPNKSIHTNLRWLDEKLTEMGRKESIRIRYVVVPGLTDGEEDIKALGRFVSRIRNLESIELLPYVTLGRYKWIELFGSYKLDSTEPATQEDIDRVAMVLREFKLPIMKHNKISV